MTIHHGRFRARTASSGEFRDLNPARLVIADTGPVNYLILIGHIDLLPALFEKVILPAAVQSELTSPKAPPSVRLWIADRPAWLELRQSPLNEPDDVSLKEIDAGEKAAIELAVSLHADLLLMDGRKGVHAAETKALRVTGALGVLDFAAERALVDFGAAIKKLERTTFRRPEALLEPPPPLTPSRISARERYLVQSAAWSAASSAVSLNGL